MGLFNLFKRKPTELAPLKTERPGIGFRLAKAKQRYYIVKMALLHDGKPLRQFYVRIKAPSRDNAAFQAKEKINVQVISARLDKSQE